MTSQIFEIGPMAAGDWESVREIYLEGIASGHATFETQAPSWENWDTNHHPFARLVLRTEEGILGWAALSRVSRRIVYEGVAEVSVYVASRARGQGFGLRLLQRLIEESEAHGVWTLQASIFTENDASIRLHRRCGFREVGRRERIAKLHSAWRDTMLMERRSTIVGTS
jgi:L-amino acid N-acyltransferase YncA